LSVFKICIGGQFFVLLLRFGFGAVNNVRTQQVWTAQVYSLSQAVVVVVLLDANLTCDEEGLFAELFSWRSLVHFKW